MAEVRILQDDGKDIIPVTHEDAVLDSNGVKISDKYAKKEDLKNIDLSEINNAIEDLNDKYDELFQSANNGKELIADAIGEPLSSEQTFSAMSTGINGLLSTFKTNMMNNGIVVEASDKFKSLIDKIATLADNEGKGIQYAEGSINNITLPAYTSGFKQYSINLNIDFTPSILMINIGKFIIETTSTYYTANTTINSLFHNSSSNAVVIMSSTETGMGAGYAYISSSNQLYMSNLRYERSVDLENITYLAIGVGEEDTTLRDSLANILQDAGVEVSEGEEMASLITKVDQKLDNSGGLDVISATELPATGKDNQICIVSKHTDSPILVTTNYNEPITEPTHLVYLGNSSSLDLILGSRVQIDNMAYYFNKVMFGDERLPSYIWSNNQWNELTKKYIPLFENQTFVNTEFSGTTGITTSSSYATLVDDSGVKAIGISGSTTAFRYFTFSKKMNFTNFTKLKVTAKASTGEHTALGIYAHNTTSLTTSPQYTTSFNTTYRATPSINAQNYTELTIDISSWAGELYLTFATNYKKDGGVNIRYISLE